MERKRSEKIRFFIRIAAVALLIGIIFLETYFIYSYINPYRNALDVEEVDISFAIGEQSGFNLNKTALTYGTINPGGNSVRRVVIGNNYQFPIVVEVFAPKSLTQFLTVENDLFIEPGESRNIAVTLQAPQDAEFANYSGKLSFVLSKRN